MSGLKALRARARLAFYRWRGSYPVTIDGERFACDPESWRYWRFVDSGKWEPHTLTIYRKLLRKTDDYLDIGAYIGPTALFASRLCRRVFCLEPDPRNYELLHKNVELNRATNIQTRRVGLYHQNTTLSFGNPEGLGTSGSSLLFSDTTGAVSIDVVTFADAVAHWNIDRLRLTKIDIEGAEFDLMPRIGAEVAARSDNVYLSTHAPYFPKAERAGRMRLLEPFFARFPFVYDHRLRRIEPADVTREEYCDQYVEFLCAREKVF